MASDSAWSRSPRSSVGVSAMVLWRLRNEAHDYADCSLDVTQTGAYRISVRRGGNLKFSALVIGWREAQQVIDERREELLQQGWQPAATTSLDPQHEPL